MGSNTGSLILRQHGVKLICDMLCSQLYFMKSQRKFQNICQGGTRMARGGIRLVHGLTKSILITYFSGMKIDPKYAFLHVYFSLFSCHVLSKICLYDQKHTPNFAHFCTPKRCMRIHCLVLKSNPNYVNLWTSLIPPLTFKWPPGICVRDQGPISQKLRSS